MKIMAVYAHPADPVTDCGGTLALHAARGDEVTIVSITHGGRIHPNLFVEEWRKEKPDASVVQATREDVIAVKRDELLAAAEILGVRDVIFLDEDDNYVGVEASTVHRIAQTIAAIQPDVIITDYPLNAAQPDTHTLATVMVLSALREVAMYVENLDKKRQTHVKQIFMTKLPTTARDALSLRGVRNDLFMDITPVIDKKLRAMHCFKSQGYDGDFAYKFIEAHDGDRGRSAGVNFAEAYVRMYNETHDALPLTEYALRRDVLTSHRDYATVNLREISL